MGEVGALAADSEILEANSGTPAAPPYEVGEVAAGRRWAGSDGYRCPLEVGRDEVPADLLARLAAKPRTSYLKDLEKMGPGGERL